MLEDAVKYIAEALFICSFKLILTGSMDSQSLLSVY
jgi:hypothetical protein